MTIARVTGVFIGTDETTGVTIANNATTTSAEIDLITLDTAEAWFNLYLKLTSTVAVGSLDVKLLYERISGQVYSDQASIIASFAPTNGTQKIPLGQYQVSRFMEASVNNNATGANATNVTLGYELFKRS